jgi:hypothetical protein
MLNPSLAVLDGMATLSHLPRELHVELTLVRSFLGFVLASDKLFLLPIARLESSLGLASTSLVKVVVSDFPLCIELNLFSLKGGVAIYFRRRRNISSSVISKRKC